MNTRKSSMARVAAYNNPASSATTHFEGDSQLGLHINSNNTKNANPASALMAHAPRRSSFRSRSQQPQIASTPVHKTNESLPNNSNSNHITTVSDSETNSQSPSLSLEPCSTAQTPSQLTGSPASLANTSPVTQKQQQQQPTPSSTSPTATKQINRLGKARVRYPISPSFLTYTEIGDDYSSPAPPPEKKVTHSPPVVAAAAVAEEKSTSPSRIVATNNIGSCINFNNNHNRSPSPVLRRNRITSYSFYSGLSSRRYHGLRARLQDRHKEQQQQYRQETPQRAQTNGHSSNVSSIVGADGTHYTVSTRRREIKSSIDGPIGRNSSIRRQMGRTPSFGSLTWDESSLSTTMNDSLASVVSRSSNNNNNNNDTSLPISLDNDEPMTQTERAAIRRKLKTAAGLRKLREQSLENRRKKALLLEQRILQFLENENREEARRILDSKQWDHICDALQKAEYLEEKLALNRDTDGPSERLNRTDSTPSQSRAASFIRPSETETLLWLSLGTSVNNNNNTVNTSSTSINFGTPSTLSSNNNKNEGGQSATKTQRSPGIISIVEKRQRTLARIMGHKSPMDRSDSSTTNRSTQGGNPSSGQNQRHSPPKKSIDRDILMIDTAKELQDVYDEVDKALTSMLAESNARNEFIHSEFSAYNNNNKQQSKEDDFESMFRQAELERQLARDRAEIESVLQLRPDFLSQVKT